MLAHLLSVLILHVAKMCIRDRINGPDAVQLSLFTEKAIVTDEEKARRVLASIPKKIGPDALSFVRRAYLTCLPLSLIHI